MKRIITSTADGSSTLSLSSGSVAYHSLYGAVTESRHVYIQSGLEYLIDSGVGELNILEIGFGTGLNALLSLKRVYNEPLLVNYLAIEPDPLPVELIAELNYPEVIGMPVLGDAFMEMHQQGDENIQPQNLSSITRFDNFRFALLKCRVQDLNFSALQTQPLISDTRNPVHFNLIYYDAFAPSFAPEMWTIETLEPVVERLVPGGTLVTFCAQGQFKRNLKALGLTVNGIPGPPGKREITRAVNDT